MRAGLSALLLDRLETRPSELPHVSSLTALVQSRFHES
jgi:hypothetical protein